MAASRFAFARFARARSAAWRFSFTLCEAGFTPSASVGDVGVASGADDIGWVPEEALTDWLVVGADVVEGPEVPAMFPLDGLIVPEVVGDTVLGEAGPADGTIMPGALTVCCVVGDIVVDGPTAAGTLPLDGLTVPDTVGDTVLGVMVVLTCGADVLAGLTVCWDVGDVEGAGF